MKLLKVSTLTFVLGLFALEAHAAPLTFYTYDFSDSIPCSSGCTVNFDLQGTIITDGLGTLAASDIVGWDITATPGGQMPIILVQNNGRFSISGSPKIVATGSDLTITRNASSDGFTFETASGPFVSWTYGAPYQPTQDVDVVFYTVGNQQRSAQRNITTPSTFTAAAVTATETPEPASLFLVLIAGFAWLGVARNQHSRRMQI